MLKWREGEKPWDVGLEAYRAAMKYVTNRTLAVDGGAHVGGWTQAMCEDFKQVVAFEPVPENFALLRENAPKAICYPVGLSDLCERAFIRPAENSGAGFPDREQGVPACFIPLDSLCLDRTGAKVGLIKLDVEGYELFALHGSKWILERDKPVVVLEEKGHGARYGIAEYRIPNFLVRYGYKKVERVLNDDIYCCSR